MVWNWLATIGTAIIGTAQAIFTQKYVTEKQKQNTTAIVQSNVALAERRDEMQVAQLKLQYIQEKERQQFQAEQAYLSNQRAKELQERQQAFQAEQARLSQQRQDELQKFIQQVQIIINDKNLDFQRWRFEQEKELQLQILQLNQDFQRELAIYQRQTSLKVVEEQKRLENSPVWLVASDILNSNITGVMPLHIFFAPPKLQFERFANAANNNKGFPDLELTLAEGLRLFFKEYAQQKRPLDFLAGALVSKTFHSEASIKALFGVLKSEPTLVLESEIDGDYLNFRVAYWGLNWSDFRYDPIISRLPYRNILYDAAKNRARKWLETREKLIATGENPEEVDKIYGADNVQNLAILQQEEKFRSSGISISDLELHYRVNNKDFEDLGQFFILYHCVFSGLIADEYFLIEYNLPPSLPQLLPHLINQVNDTATLKELIKSIVFYYQKMYDALGEDKERCALIPDLELDLALGLANLADKIWAKSRITYSLEIWLRIRSISVFSNQLDSLLDSVEANITNKDQDYVDKLNRLLRVIGKNRSLKIVNTFYEPELPKQEKFEFNFDQDEEDTNFDNQQDLNVEYYNLVAKMPNSNSSIPIQWRHQKCEGKLQIGNNGNICCDSCHQEKLIFDWYITDHQHLSERPFGTRINACSAMSLAGQMIPIAGQKWMSQFLDNIDQGNSDNNDPEEYSKDNYWQPKKQFDSNSNYYNLVAQMPNSNSSIPVQWRHQKCEGKLQIADNGKIRCDCCHQEKLIFDWYITDHQHLSERPFGTRIDASSAMSLAGQMIPIAGQKWMNQFLDNIE